MTVWFTSDTHFDHKNIIDHCDRPYPDVPSMNEAIIREWNDCVQPIDTVYHLGDFVGFNDKNAQKYFDRLNGHKVLIAGNHDHKKVKNLGWMAVHDLYDFKIGEQEFVLCHYPMSSWKNKSHGSMHLFGHVHGTEVAHARPHSRCMDVGWDAFIPTAKNYRFNTLISAVEVIKFLNDAPTGNGF